MKISYSWLKDFIPTTLSAEETAALLTDLGLEVEGISSYEKIRGGLKGVVVGKVVECAPHPNADRLKLTKVDIGGEAPLQIVCGAPNVAAGQKVAVATLGATLYNTSGESLTISKSKIRGELSEGMICAEDELGIGDSHQGIVVLPESAAVGTPCAEIFDVSEDHVFEIGITPNRADALSHYGVARDLRAGLAQQYGQSFGLITPPVEAVPLASNSALDIEVLRPDLAPRYCGVVLEGIKIKDSPEWLKPRLKSIGITPKNNVIDITNYVLHELGQPLHAFDRDALSGHKIVVKTLPEGTEFTTLDGQARKLSPYDLMICDVEKPLCIAGVFGGLHSGITDATTAIFLESAYFDPISIRRTAKHHGLNTDASFRFERGVDPERVVFALQRAVFLLKEYAGAKVVSGATDLYPVPIPARQVPFSLGYLHKLSGDFSIQESTVKNILQSLEINISSESARQWILEVPAYRVDVCRQADIAEEILRVYGYNRLVMRQSISMPIDAEALFSPHLLEETLSNQLCAIGFTEIMTTSLTKPAYSDGIKMLNPMSPDLSVLRTKMLYSALEAAAYNYNRQQSNLRLFEFGKTYHPDDYKEAKHLVLLISGQLADPHWQTPAKPMDFFYLKGIVEGILKTLRIDDYSLEIQPPTDIFSESVRLVSSDKKRLVELGEIHPSVLKSFNLKQDVLYADFDWDAVLSLVKQQKRQPVKALSRFPEVSRDLSLTIDAGVLFSQIEGLAYETDRHILKRITLFDVYQGSPLPEGKKSYGINFIFQSREKTLTDQEIDNAMTSLIATFEKRLNAVLR